jgi:hypothetical protein
MFELYTKEHYGTRSIAKYLNDRDIPTPRSTMWNSSLVCKVLRCKTYLGIYELHKQTKDKPLIESPVMPHLVILDESTWHKAQDLLQKNSNGPRRSPTRRGSLLLTGLAYCGHCGKKMTSFYAYTTAERKKPLDERIRRYYYRCVSESKPKSSIPKCRPSMYSADILEASVIRYAKKFVLEIDREKLIADHEDSIKTRMDEAVKRMDKAEADLAKNEREVKRLKDEIMRSLLGESTFPQATLSEMLKSKEAESLELAKRHDEAQNHIMDLDQELSFQKTVAEEFNDWSARFDTAATADKKAMLLNIIDRIDVHGDSVEVTFKVELNPLNRWNGVEQIKPIDTDDMNDNGASFASPTDAEVSLYPRAVKRYEYAPGIRSKSPA